MRTPCQRSAPVPDGNDNARGGAARTATCTAPARAPRARSTLRAMSARLAERRWQLAIRLTAAAAVCSLGLLLAAVLLPTSGGDTTSQGVATLTQETFVQSHGAWALALIAVPLLATGVVAAAVVYRRRDDARWARPAAWTAIGVLAVLALLSITSVGAFMVPVAVLLVLSVRLAPGWGDVRARPASRGAEAADGSESLATGS
jgi:hypothetical protein